MILEILAQLPNWLMHNRTGSVQQERIKKVTSLGDGSWKLNFGLWTLVQLVQVGSSIDTTWNPPQHQVITRVLHGSARIVNSSNYAYGRLRKASFIADCFQYCSPV